MGWLYDAPAPAERLRLRGGVERRAVLPYLDATMRAKPMFWYSAEHNWNPVCNGGATVLALVLGAESGYASDVLRMAAPAMAAYWNHLGADGSWDEGTGYWTYGHRYAFMAADALRRAGYRDGSAYLDRPGARTTGYFPLVFNPGRNDAGLITEFKVMIRPLQAINLLHQQMAAMLKQLQGEKRAS